MGTGPFVCLVSGAAVAKKVAITQWSPIRAGMVADLGRGDLVWVARDATKRPDWAAINRALGTAFARGAEIHMVSEGAE